jgi:hypothetical protein
MVTASGRSPTTPVTVCVVTRPFQKGVLLFSGLLGIMINTGRLGWFSFAAILTYFAASSPMISSGSNFGLFHLD